MKPNWMCYRQHPVNLILA